MSNTPWYIWLSPVITIIGLIFRNQLSKIGDHLFNNRWAGFLTFSSLSTVLSIIICIKFYNKTPFTKYWISLFTMSAMFVFANLMLLGLTLVYIKFKSAFFSDENQSVIFNGVRALARDEIYKALTVEWTKKVNAVQAEINAIQQKKGIGSFSSDLERLEELKIKLENLNKNKPIDNNDNLPVHNAR